MALYAPLINSTYFSGELTIGQVEQQQVSAELLFYIRKHEYDILSLLMGPALYAAFYAGIKVATPDDRWKKMAYGIAFILDVTKVKTGYKADALGNYKRIPRYQYRDKMNVIYRGLLKRADGDPSVELSHDGYGASSPLAKYIYYWWMRAHVTASGGATESAQLVHNGTAVINNQKMIRAWNEHCVEVFEFYLFLDMYITDYPEFNLEPNERYNPGPMNEFNFL